MFDRLGPLQRAYLVALCAPAGLVIVGLKLSRIPSMNQSIGVISSLDLVRSELLLAAGLTVGGLSILEAVDARWTRRFAMGAVQVVWLLILTLEVGGHQFFMTTGSALDYYLFSFPLENFSGNVEVIGSEVPGWLVFWTPAALVWVLGGPWWLRWRILMPDPASQNRTPEPARRLPTVALAVASGMMLTASAAPPIFVQGKFEGRSTTANVVLTGISALRESFRAPVPIDDPTIDAHLEPNDSPPTGGRPNVVIVLLESTRARSTTMYNPDLETTPYLARLSDHSTLAERAYAVVPHTSKAMVATLCGVVPSLHMPVTEALDGHLPTRCLADLLGDVGYQTAFFDSAYRYFENTEGLVDNMGYDTFVSVDDMDTTGFQKVNYFGREDNVMLAPSRRWLESHQATPFLATYLTLTPHHDYTPPDRYPSHDFADPDRLNRYLNSINYLDHFAHNLIDQYKEMGLYKRTIFVFLGDHGEGFGEHGRRQHDNVIYQEGLHIPLIIHDPRDPDPTRIDLPVNQLDVLPTLASMLGYELVGDPHPGANIYELDEVRRLRAQCWYEHRCMAEIYGDEKYVYHFGRQPDQFFDLGDDPGERHDLAAGRDDLAKRRRRLIDWRRRVNATYP